MKKGVVSVTIDEKTKNLLDKYSQDHSISRSAVIRLVVNEFFIREERHCGTTSE
jgi:hypothetical protein